MSMGLPWVVLLVGSPNQAKGRVVRDGLRVGLGGEPAWWARAPVVACCTGAETAERGDVDGRSRAINQGEHDRTVRAGFNALRPDEPVIG
jgi:hypothetical protein